MPDEPAPPNRERDALRRAASPVMLGAVRKAAAAITERVELLYFGSDDFPSASLDTLQLCQMLLEAGPSIRLVVFDSRSDEAKCREHGVLFFPTLVILGKNRGSLRFLGTPSGHGLPVLVAALKEASTGLSGLGPVIRRRAAAIKRPLVLRVFISPEMEYCKRPALLALRLAVENEHIRSELINHIDFPVLSQRYKIGTAPRTIVNDSVEIGGALAEARFLEEIFSALVPQVRPYS